MNGPFYVMVEPPEPCFAPMVGWEFGQVSKFRRTVVLRSTQWRTRVKLTLPKNDLDLFFVPKATAPSGEAMSPTLEDSRSEP